MLSLQIDEKTLEGQMKSLSSTTRNVRAAKKICRNKDTIHTLLDALNTKPKFTKMVEYSLECLKVNDNTTSACNTPCTGFSSYLVC